MAEIVGIASGIVTLVSAAYKTCGTLHKTLEGCRSAHAGIRALASDLEGFYLVLGTLRGVLEDEISSAAAAEAVMSGSVSKVLDQSMELFKEISTLVGTFNCSEHKFAQEVWLKVLWNFQQKKLAAYRSQLMECKLTLNIAIAVANMCVDPRM